MVPALGRTPLPVLLLAGCELSESRMWERWPFLRGLSWMVIPHGPTSGIIISDCSDSDNFLPQPLRTSHLAWSGWQGRGATVRRAERLCAAGSAH